jgi:hypothetical protein
MSRVIVNCRKLFDISSSQLFIFNRKGELDKDGIKTLLTTKNSQYVSEHTYLHRPVFTKISARGNIQFAPTPQKQRKKYFNILTPLNLILILLPGAFTAPSPPLNTGLYLQVK